MSPAAATIFVIDDDPAVRDSLTVVLESEYLRVETFASAENFLGAYRPMGRSCAIVDIRLPGMDGLELQQEISHRNILLALIFLTGYGGHWPLQARH